MLDTFVLTSCRLLNNQLKTKFGNTLSSSSFFNTYGEKRKFRDISTDVYVHVLYTRWMDSKTGQYYHDFTTL